MNASRPAPVAPAPDPAAAYDAVAPEYDRLVAEDRWMRRLLWRHHLRVFRPGDRVLDLGCGTGLDALHLARHGVRVTAVDVSAGMLERLRARVAAAGLGAWIEARRGDLADLDAWPAERWDGVLSSFAALNTLADPAAAIAAAAGRLREGGGMVLHLLAPASLGLRGRGSLPPGPGGGNGRPGTSGRVVIGGRSIPHRVLPLSEMSRWLAPAPDLRVRAAYALGFLWPQSWGRRLPAWAGDALGRLEPLLGATRPFRSRGRFYVLDLEKSDRR